MRNAGMIASKLLPVLAVAALIFLAQRLAVEAYWEIHPEAKLEAEVRRPLVEKAISNLRDHRQKERQQALNLEKALESYNLAKSPQRENPLLQLIPPTEANSRN